MDRAVTLTIEALQRDRQKVQAQIEVACENLGSCRTSWAKKQQVHELLTGMGLKPEDHGWSYGPQDEDARNAAVAGYEREIKQLRDYLAEYDKSILAILSKW